MPQGPSYTLFESGQVRPLAFSSDGRRLFAVNTPDARLEVFQVDQQGLTPLTSVRVGLEPVAVALRGDDEAWVVNHLSDSVSIVRLLPRNPSRPGRRGGLQAQVTRTLWVGDEPRDIVFAGTDKGRAFISAAHRGQNAPFDPQLTVAGVGRADVWVFDAENPGPGPGGTPLTIVSLFADTPRALAVSADGERVFAAGFHSGNKTTVVPEDTVTANGGLPGPRVDSSGVPQPDTGLIVRHDGVHWVDDVGRFWDDQVKFSLPDKDVFVLDALADPPRPLAAPQGEFSGTGTVLFNMAVHPTNGTVYLSNTEALNQVRFEGPGDFADTTVQGHLHESRITILRPDGTVLTRHLNKHIDYGQCCQPIPNPENAASLAFPMGMAISANGAQLYLAAFGSSKVGVFKTEELENDTFVPDESSHIKLSGGGPTGLVLDEARRRLYVLTRFDNSIAIVDLGEGLETGRMPLYNPEPPSIVQGRPFLYDASLTSSHGDSACASCHVFGDLDSLAWDLGDPDITTLANPGPFSLAPNDPGGGDFRALKGPMTTQSLRGLANHGPMHWRGDRTGGRNEPSAQPDSGSFDENEAFLQFNPAFVGLVGRHQQLSEEDMQAFSDFALQIVYPPNPIRNLDNSLTTQQQAGRDFYFSPGVSDGIFNCNGCHVLDPEANADFGEERPGFFGTDGRFSQEGEPQVFKVPHLRNMYQKVGMFGMPVTGFILPGFNGFRGDQIRGYGFLHDGSVDTPLRFLSAIVFLQFPFLNPDGFPLGLPGDVRRREVEAFLFVYPSNLAPIVGQQLTWTPSSGSAADERVSLLIKRSNAGECDLVVSVLLDGRERGFLHQGGEAFLPDRRSERPWSLESLQASLPTRRGLTFTCMPPGSGLRSALDRDEDGGWDGDEVDAGSDPANPSDRPSGGLLRRRAQGRR